jgi:predicted site-specific integrase-resolvase
MKTPFFTESNPGQALMERLVGIGDAAQALGVSIATLRRWEVAGRLSEEHTAGSHRRHNLTKLRPEMFRVQDEANRRSVAYARVSSHDQRDVLEIVTVFSALDQSASGRWRL